MSEQILTLLNQVRPLTVDQFAACQKRALAHAQTQHGERPIRKTVAEEQDPIWDGLDLVALIVFLAALLVSGAAQITFQGGEANIAFNQIAKNVSGFVFDLNTFSLVHQIGYLFLSEAAMILFMVMFAAIPLPTGKKVARRALLTVVFLRGVFLVLAVYSAAYVLHANMSTGADLFVAGLAPAVTIGVGLYIEPKVSRMWAQSSATTKVTRKRQKGWDMAAKDLTKHPGYFPRLRLLTAQDLVRKHKGLAIAQVTLIEAVERQLLHETVWQTSNRDVSRRVKGAVLSGEATFIDAKPPKHRKGKAVLDPTVPVVPVLGGNGHKESI